MRLLRRTRITDTRSIVALTASAVVLAAAGAASEERRPGRFASSVRVPIRTTHASPQDSWKTEFPLSRLGHLHHDFGIRRITLWIVRPVKHLEHPLPDFRLRLDPFQGDPEVVPASEASLS